MNYTEALEYIHSINWTFCKPGLDRISELCQKLGNPQNHLKFVHVAGTNGKGSFCAILESILREAGYKTGLFTSPYIKVFNERMQINKNAPEILYKNAKYAMGIFASTSPSYLILQSLDRFNSIAESFSSRLDYIIPFISSMKQRLQNHGYTLYGNEVLKLTIKTKPYGYTGYEFGKMLEKKNLFPEFYDNDFLVLMLPLNKDSLMALTEILFSIPKKESIITLPPEFEMPQKAMSVRSALFMPFEEIDIKDAKDRILHSPMVSCPPAVPIVVSGEIISENAIKVFEYYKISKVKVIK